MPRNSSDACSNFRRESCGLFPRASEGHKTQNNAVAKSSPGASHRDQEVNDEHAANCGHTISIARVSGWRGVLLTIQRDGCNSSRAWCCNQSACCGSGLCF